MFLYRPKLLSSVILCFNSFQTFKFDFVVHFFAKLLTKGFASKMSYWVSLIPFIAI